jgi:hypothetical protein
MAKQNTTVKKTTKKTTTRKKTTAKKSTTRKKTTRRKKVTDLNLWTYNEECKLERVKVPIQYRMDFLYRFGVMTPPDKQQVLEWLEAIKNV